MMTIHRMMLKTHPLLTTHVRSVHSGHSREKFPKGSLLRGFGAGWGRQPSPEPCSEPEPRPRPRPVAGRFFALANRLANQPGRGYSCARKWLT